MFEPADRPRVFALPPGVDFPQAVVAGLDARLRGQPPEALAAVTLLVNTRRMKRRFVDVFAQGPARLLPRIRLVSELGQDMWVAGLEPAVSPLRRRLEIAELVGRLLSAQPDLAPRSMMFELADSLAALMNEMQGEGVSPATIRQLDVQDVSGHWARSLAFFSLVERFFGAESGEPADPEARQRRVIEALAAAWSREPPGSPIIVAGSTGSRGATRLLMSAVARLPQGALILPGYDFDMPDPVWEQLDHLASAEDHPQTRFALLRKELALGAAEILPWSQAQPANPRRNAFVSLALRPAPVTDQWQVEGRSFAGIDSAFHDTCLIEAASPRAEALALALILREAVERGESAALICPDRRLTRQVAAALDRWRIVPDDSAGEPLSSTPPGRLFRHVATCLSRSLTGVDLLVLLKHPLVCTGSFARGDHLRHVRDLELEALREWMPFPSPDLLLAWARRRNDRLAWADWVGDLLRQLAQAGMGPLADHVARLLAVTSRLAAGPGDDGSGALWHASAGEAMRLLFDQLEIDAPFGGEMGASDFKDLFEAVLSRGVARDPVAPHPLVKIWGTLESRAMGVDLTLLAGLNEGSWPESPAPDPWLNRRMRLEAGLLLPERRIGLAAHDFQQAIGAGRVVLSRAVRNEESETVPSRWLNRITNLMAGMSDAGKATLDGMRQRGDRWLVMAQTLEATEPVARAPRPAPRPPVDVRPKQLSVTRVTRLIRDPYAVYAEQILGLRPLKPLHREPDAPLRGTLLHKVLDEFVTDAPPDETPDRAIARLIDRAASLFDQEVAWPAARVLWLARLRRVAEVFLAGESERLMRAAPVKTEVRGAMKLPGLDFTLTGTADRIDRSADGSLFIYDYKTGSVPTRKQQEAYDKQLLFEAVMAEAGAFEGLPPARVAEVGFVGLGADPRFERLVLDRAMLEATRDGLVTLLARYAHREQGYLARRIAQSQSFGGDYDHLSRYGEWDHGTPASPEDVG